MNATYVGKDLSIRAAELRIHMKTHTREKNYECDVCGKSLGQSSNLATHIKIHSRTKNQFYSSCQFEESYENSHRKEEL